MYTKDSFNVYKASARASKAYAVHMASTRTSEAIEKSRMYWYHQRTKTPYSGSDIIYWYRCETVDCNEEYIEESTRIFGERYI